MKTSRRHKFTMDNGYIDCLLAKDMDTGEDGRNRTGEVAPILRLRR